MGRWLHGYLSESILYGLTHSRGYDANLLCSWKLNTFAELTHEAMRYIHNLRICFENPEFWKRYARGSFGWLIHALIAAALHDSARLVLHTLSSFSQWLT